MELLDELKLTLDITWEDDLTNRKLAGILSRAKTELNEYAGAEIDFQGETAERQLLLDLCRYIYNNAAEDFETNFKGKLIALRAKYMVEAMEDVADG